jgi:hypothetical protein
LQLAGLFSTNGSGIPKVHGLRDGNSVGRKWGALDCVSTDNQSDDDDPAGSDGHGNDQFLSARPLLLPE